MPGLSMTFAHPGKCMLELYGKPKQVLALYSIFGVERHIPVRCIPAVLGVDVVDEVVFNRLGDLIERPMKMPSRNVNYIPESWIHVMMTAAMSLSMRVHRSMLTTASHVFMIAMRIEPGTGIHQVAGSIDTRYKPWHPGMGTIDLVRGAPPLVSAVQCAFNARDGLWYSYTEPEFSFAGGSRDKLAHYSEPVEDYVTAGMREFQEETGVSLTPADLRPVSEFLAQANMITEEAKLEATMLERTGARWIEFAMTGEYINGVMENTHTSDVNDVAIACVLTKDAQARYDAVTGVRHAALLRGDQVVALFLEQGVKWSPKRFRLGKKCPHWFHVDNQGWVRDPSGARVPLLSEQIYAGMIDINFITSVSVTNAREEFYADISVCRLRRRLLEFLSAIRRHCKVA